MITYQVNDKTYFIPTEWYYSKEDLSLDEFVKEIINSKYLYLDLEDSFDAIIEKETVELTTFSKILSDETDRKWMEDEEIE